MRRTEGLWHEEDCVSVAGGELWECGMRRTGGVGQVEDCGVWHEGDCESVT